MIEPKLYEKIIRLLRERFGSEEGAEHYEEAHTQARLLCEAGYLSAARAAYTRLLRVNPRDREAQDALQEIEDHLQ